MEQKNSKKNGSQKEQPINKVMWIPRSHLKPNDYNPNFVAPPEMKLLKTSILETGWTQPIVIDKDGVIVDGFHRYTIAADKEVSEMTDGKVPVVVLEDIDDNHRRMATIRHNRARGTHAVLEMSSIVTYLIEQGHMTAKEIMHRLGMDEEEVLRLSAKGGMPAAMIKQQKDYAKAWKPGEKK